MVSSFDLLDQAIFSTLETYSNVHRGSGIFSQITTALFDRAREVVRDYLSVDRKYEIIFCTPRRAEKLQALAGAGSCKSISSHDLGLPLGVTALAVRRSALPKGVPPESGGGTARLIAPEWVLWEHAPDRFEAGTPPIVNVIALARALQLAKQPGTGAFAAVGEDPAGEINAEPFPGLSGKALLKELQPEQLGRGLSVPALQGEQPYLFLDHAASTPTFRPVWESFRNTLRVKESDKPAVIDRTRSLILSFLNAPEESYDLLFTSNTTEAVNLAADALRMTVPAGVSPVVLGTLLEHSSNDLPWRAAPFACERLFINKEGFIDPVELETTLQSYNRLQQQGNRRIVLVTLTGASNVLGTYNDLETIGRIVHANGAKLMVDAAQMIAHRPIDMTGWGIDYLAFSGHKAYAPFGSGALVARRELIPFPEPELKAIRRSGESNTAGIAAMGTAIGLLQRIGLNTVREEETKLTKELLEGLSKIDGVKLFGITDPASPAFARRGGVVVFETKGKMSDKVSKALALHGIGTRYGCHCSHILVKHIIDFPRRLEKVQRLIVTLFPRLQLPGVARVSIGIGNTSAEIGLFLKIMGEIAGRKSLPKETDPKRREMFIQERLKRGLRD